MSYKRELKFSLNAGDSIETAVIAIKLFFLYGKEIHKRFVLSRLVLNVQIPYRFVEDEANLLKEKILDAYLKEYWHSKRGVVIILGNNKELQRFENKIDKQLFYYEK